MQAFIPQSANWRIVIPNLQQYKDSSPQQLHQLKCLILQRLKNRPQDPRSHIRSQFDRGLRYYHIALEHHANGVPHLDILLIYEKSIRRNLTDYDYLYKHGDITTYRKLNAAILNYGRKQDKDALSNLPQDTTPVINVDQLKHDPYAYLYDRMKQDPLNFNLEQYVQRNQLSKYISSWSSIKTKLKDMQLVAANLKLRDKPGFRLITRAFIESVLSSDQLTLYDSWQGYQTIVNYFNQILIYGPKRPFKTKHLLVVGPAHIGKTSLVSQPNNDAGRVPLQQLIPTYHMGMRHWFPKYQDGTYSLILWNQMKLTSYSYDFLLKFLQGSPVDLPYHGGATKKADNQLIYMTSNLSLERHVAHKFMHLQDRQAARQNLSKRIEQVVVPRGYNLFILQKLLVAA